MRVDIASCDIGPEPSVLMAYDVRWDLQAGWPAEEHQAAAAAGASSTQICVPIA